jgi:Transglycosylase SLT domain
MTRTLTIGLFSLALAGCAVQKPLFDSTDHTQIKSMIARKVETELGPKWVPVSLKIAKLESNFNPKVVGPRTRHGHAVGLFQLLPSSARALGYSPSRLREAEYNTEAGIAHMKQCINAGVSTDWEMSLCHVAGPMGWNRRLRKRSQSYKTKYARLVSKMGTQ